MSVLLHSVRWIRAYQWERASAKSKVAALVVFGSQAGSVPVLQTLRLSSTTLQKNSEEVVLLEIQ
jgi:hypothetical protein